MPDVHEVRKASADETVALAEVLGRAFHDDPVSTFVMPDAGRRARGLPRFFEIELRKDYLGDGEVYTTADLSGAALWAPPGKPRPGLRTAISLFPMVPVIGVLRVPKIVRALAGIELQHPKEPHFYLGVLGTEPDRQGKGVGSALLAPVLSRCDSEGIPAYLESSKEANVPFYRRHGFEVTSVYGPRGGGPRLWLMWREPRPPAES